MVADGEHTSVDMSLNRPRSHSEGREVRLTESDLIGCGKAVEADG